MSYPIWNSFVTQEDAELLGKAENLKVKLQAEQKNENAPFEQDDKEIANLHLILKTAQCEREKMEQIFNKLKIEMHNLKRTAKHENIGGNSGPTVEIFSGYFAVI